MRYRMELVEDDLVVRNVETGIKLGTVDPILINRPDDPDRAIVHGCTVYGKDRHFITDVPAHVSNSLQQAMNVVSYYEAQSGYQGFREGAEENATHKVEWLLGELMAEASVTIAHAVVEHENDGVTVETKEKLAELMSRLHAIWYASRFGSFNGELRQYEPYFARAKTQ